jgi:tRNA-specific 2-thiouridylase
VFPLGDSTKAQVRAEAARRGLAVADKPDSHDICFIADGDTRGFLTRQLGAAPGDIVDVDTGAVVGAHEGTFGFTVGQRRGLGLDRGIDGAPRYVLSLSPKTNTVTVGTAERLVVDEVVAVDPVWTTGRAPSSGWRGHVQLRAHGQVSPARLVVGDTEVVAALARPQQGIAAGQAMVMYDGDEVLGSATITAARRADSTDTSISSSTGADTVRVAG